MKRLFLYLTLLTVNLLSAQTIEFETLLNDKISIRALQIYDNKVWYVGTDSKFGYVSLKNSTDKKQIRLSDKSLQFRTLGQDNNAFYAINIESPASFFRINKKKLETKIVFVDTLKTAFYDALHFVDGEYAFAFSDPDVDNKLRLATFNFKNKHLWSTDDRQFKNIKLNNGEAAFAASNTNISAGDNFLWIATGGISSRILRLDLVTDEIQIFDTPIIQGNSSQGIYSIDFYNKKFGIAVGGDYTKQSANINNIATTKDAGKTWQIQASGKNAGYKTCVKIRPGSKGKEIIAVGDQNIEFSKDYGKTWTTISNEKGLYVCQWIDKNTLVFAGKDRIIRMRFR